MTRRILKVEVIDHTVRIYPYEKCKMTEYHPTREMFFHHGDILEHNPDNLELPLSVVAHNSEKSIVDLWITRGITVMKGWLGL